ncbi:MAG: hypothetical protein IPQ02_15180 [Saprospiraceae bacterium]|nr:hypothetical protein [Candidatus Defluviibacterium haderslevense]
MNLGQVINKSSLVFGTFGAIGAIIGESITEFFLTNKNGSFLGNVIHISIWTAFISLGIAVALLFKLNIISNKKKFNKEYLQVGYKSILIGAAIGGLAQLIYTFTQNSFAEISRVFCWGIMGAGLGISTSRIIPNYPKSKGKVAGFVGGILGGILFVLSNSIFPESIARFIGIGFIGFLIGLLISIVELLYREAYLTLKWSANESSSMSLGSKNLILGSSPNADIYLPSEKGYLDITAIITFKNGIVQIEDKLSNRILNLKNGSKINLGFVEITINTIA